VGFYFYSNPITAVLGAIDGRNKNNVQIFSRNITSQEFDDYFDSNSPQYAFLDSSYENVYFVTVIPKIITKFSNSNPQNLTFVAKYQMNINAGAKINFFINPIFEGYIYSVSQNDSLTDPNSDNIILFNVTRSPVPGNGQYSNLPVQSAYFVTYGNLAGFTFNTNTSKLYLGTSYNKVIQVDLKGGNMTFDGVMSLFPSNLPGLNGGPLQSMIVDTTNNLLYVQTGWWGDFYRINLNKFCPDNRDCKENTPTNDNPSNKDENKKISLILGLVFGIIAIVVVVVIVVLIVKRSKGYTAIINS